MKFSICVPTKDRGKELLDWLNKHYSAEFQYIMSIEKQDIGKYEYLKMWDKKNITAIHIDNDRGLGYARNMLAKESIRRGDDITFFTDDNAHWDNKLLPNFVRNIYKSKKIHWLGGFNQSYVYFHNISHKKNMIKANTGVIEYPRILPAVFALKTEDLKKYNFTCDIKYGEDMDMLWTLKKEYYPTNPSYMDTGFHVHKAHHMKGGTLSFKKKKIMEETCDFFNKKYGGIFFKLQNSKFRKTPVKVSHKKFDEFLKVTNEQRKI